jgi:molecular chaperone DnaK (HSP70)
MVFDFGAGTLDLAIVTCNCLIEEGTIEWLAKIELNIGDNNLGGIDIDMALEKYIKKRHPNLQQIIDSKNESIKFIVEKIKIQLSKLYDEHKMTSISIVEKYYNQLITVSIQDYFDLLDEHFKMRIIGLMDQLHNSNIKKTDIDTVLLIGGSCYNPWVKKLVSSYYEKQINEYKIKISDHFETYDINIKDIGVSLGATCVNRKKNNYGDTLILTESLPLSIGIDTVNNLMCKLLPKNTLIPCVAKKYFTTCEDNQQKIEVKLYQGECDDVRKNFFLGDFIIDKLDLEPQGKIVVIINVAVTTDGLITIEGKVKNTDKFDKKIIINRYNTNLDSKKIESNVKDYELNDSVFNSIMTKYYELVTMLNRLQFNLIDNISCKTDDTIIDDILKSFWDDLIIVYTLMTQSNKIKQNIQQLKKFINYISDTLHYESITHNLDLSDDKAIIVKLDKLNKYINKNLLHLVSSYQIKADGADKTQNNDYDTFDDDIKLKQVNSITNPTEILDSTERSLLYQNENDNSTSKDNLSYIKQIKDLVIMLVNEIESLVMPDTNKLLILEILDRHEIFLDTISRNESFNGKSQLELLQNTCMSISNINDQKLISELQNKLNDLSNESKTFERDYNNILECIINYKIIDNKTEEKRKKKNKNRIDRRKAKKVGAMRQD